MSHERFTSCEQNTLKNFSDAIESGGFRWI